MTHLNILRKIPASIKKIQNLATTHNPPVLQNANPSPLIATKTNQTSPKVNPITTGYYKNNPESTNQHGSKTTRNPKLDQPKITKINSKSKRLVELAAWREVESERGMVEREIVAKQIDR